MLTVSQGIHIIIIIIIITIIIIIIIIIIIVIKIMIMIMVLVTLCTLGSFLSFSQPVENSAIMIIVITIKAFIITPYQWANDASVENLLMCAE